MSPCDINKQTNKYCGLTPTNTENHEWKPHLGRVQRCHPPLTFTQKDPFSSSWLEQNPCAQGWEAAPESVRSLQMGQQYFVARPATHEESQLQIQLQRTSSKSLPFANQHWVEWVAASWYGITCALHPNTRFPGSSPIQVPVTHPTSVPHFLVLFLHADFGGHRRKMRDWPLTSVVPKLPCPRGLVKIPRIASVWRLILEKPYQWHH